MSCHRIVRGAGPFFGLAQVVLGMKTGIPGELLGHLVEIGREERFTELEFIGSAFPSVRGGDFMRLRPDSWLEAVSQLSESDAVFLIKALTKLEHYPNFKAGSVSPVIWIFRGLKNASERTELIDWILANTENDYLPFGSQNHGAKSLAEYRQISVDFAGRDAIRRDEERERQRSARSRKAADASQKLFGAIRRKDESAIRALLARGADFAAVDASGRSARDAAAAAGLAHLFIGSESEQGPSNDPIAADGADE